jgi:hypothetical protein
MDTNPHYTNEQLLEIAKKNNIPDDLYADFVDCVAREKDELIKDGSQPDEIKTESIKFALEDILKIATLLQKGHSKAWAELYVNSREEHQLAFNYAYCEMKKINPAQVIEELKVHCRSISCDEYHQKHFIYLMEHGEGAAKPCPDEQAAIYSKVFKEQLQQERSEIFAHQYADLKAGGQYVEEYCFRFAQAYDDAIQKGKPEDYAFVFADKMGDYYADYYGRYIEDPVIDRKNHEFKERKILGYMKGWEYAKAHQLHDKNIFIACYENTYIEASYADHHPISFTSEDDFDQQVLKSVLVKLKMI